MKKFRIEVYSLQERMTKGFSEDLWEDDDVIAEDSAEAIDLAIDFMFEQLNNSDMLIVEEREVNDDGDVLTIKGTAKYWHDNEEYWDDYEEDFVFYAHEIEEDE